MKADVLDAKWFGSRAVLGLIARRPCDRRSQQTGHRDLDRRLEMKDIDCARRSDASRLLNMMREDVGLTALDAKCLSVEREVSPTSAAAVSTTQGAEFMRSCGTRKEVASSRCL
jgi:hypothetical protein